nr:DUF2085 domain-containing protein [Candidatus Njordarchaeota archaeon]
MSKSLSRKGRLLRLLLSHHPPGRLDRCLRIQLGGNVVYVCARCTGIFTGLFSAFLVLGLVPQLIFSGEESVIIGSLFILPVYIDWATQSTGTRESNNKLRVLTGFIAGYGMSLLLLLMGTFLKLVLIAVNLYIGAILLVYLFWGRRSSDHGETVSRRKVVGR